MTTDNRLRTTDAARLPVMLVLFLNALGVAFLALIIALSCLCASGCVTVPEKDSQGNETGREYTQPAPAVKETVEAVGDVADAVTGLPIKETALGALALFSALLGYLTVREKNKAKRERAEKERYARAGRLAVLAVEAAPIEAQNQVKAAAARSPLSDETTRETIRKLKG